MAWTEASKVLNSASDLLRRDSSSSTVPAEEEFMQEIASVIPKNIVANRFKFFENSSGQEKELRPASRKNSFQCVDKRDAESNPASFTELTTNGYLKSCSRSGDHPETVLDSRFGYDNHFGSGPSSLPTGKEGRLERTVDNNFSLPPKTREGKKPLLSITKSWNGDGGKNSSPSGLLLSDQFLQRRNSFGSSNGKLDSKEISKGVMQQGGGVNGRVSSPSLTLDSGRGSSSLPSSPGKEMSPVQTAGAPAGIMSSNSSHNTSPVFARKLSRPMEYLLGQNGSGDDSQSEPGFVPDPPISGTFASYCSDPLASFVTGSSGYTSGVFSRRDSERNNNFQGAGGDCEILQITEDYEPQRERVGRKDSLEDNVNHEGVINSDIGSVPPVQPQFLVGGDIMEADLDVPNEVFGPVSHAEILSRNSANSHSGKGIKLETSASHASRARSSSGGDKSTLSALYGTPHWWPDSPPPDDNCPPQPPSSTNSSPFKKPFLLNNNNYNIANLQSLTSTRLKGNSSSSSLTDHIKDLSLESNASQKSRGLSSPLSASGGNGESMEVKKLTPMAFTIDFSDSEGGSQSEAASAKKAAMAERLSKFAPRHKRNPSLTRDDVGAKDGEPISLASSTKSKTNSLGRTTQQQNQKQSSANAVADSPTKSSSLPKKLNSKHPSGGSNSTNNNDSGLRSLSPETISSTTSSSSRSAREQIKTPKLSTTAAIRENSMTRKKSNNQGRSGVAIAKREEIKKIVSPPVVKLNDLSKAPKPQDKEDTASEAGTYTVEKEAPEVQNARENIEEVFGLGADGSGAHVDLDKDNEQFSAEPGTHDWVREWAELAAQQHQQKQPKELPDSQYFLRETETLVSAIQERVSKHMKYGGSDSEDEHRNRLKSQSQSSTPTNTKKRPPSRSSPFHRESSVLSDSGYGIGYQSDYSNEDESANKNQLGKKMNKFNIWRGRAGVGYDSELTSDHHQHHQQTVNLSNSRGISPKACQVNGNKFSNGGSGLRSSGSGARTSSPHFARNDGGRFSLRMPKSRTPPAQMPPPAPPRHGQSSYSSTDSKQMNGHKSDNQPKKFPGKNQGKIPGNRSNSTLTAKEVELANWKRRKNYDPMKAAAEGKKGRGKGDSGAEETVQIPPVVESPKVQRREMLTKSLSFHQESYSPKSPSEDEDMIYIVDEVDSSHSNSPNHLGLTRSYHEDVMYYGMPQSSQIRQKNKLEALDNLVIATIHSLSNKVRTSSKQLLEKLQIQHSNDENGALLEEMVNQLKELEGPNSNSSPNKSPSRELSGTLKNLKKLEQVILVLDKVLCEDFETDLNS